jgi:hypothetical protein
MFSWDGSGDVAGMGGNRCPAETARGSAAHPTTRPFSPTRSPPIGQRFDFKTMQAMLGHADAKILPEVYLLLVDDAVKLERADARRLT